MARFIINTNPKTHKVDIKVSDDREFVDWMMATEFLLHKTAQLSCAGYEKAQDLICEGAMGYKVTEEVQ